LRPLEDRIRELGAKAVEARDHELEQVISELKSALHEHSERFRKLSAATLARLARSRRPPLP